MFIARNLCRNDEIERMKASFPAVEPPRPQKKPTQDEHHGIRRIDDYA